MPESTQSKPLAVRRTEILDRLEELELRIGWEDLEGSLDVADRLRQERGQLEAELVVLHNPLLAPEQ